MSLFDKFAVAKQLQEGLVQAGTDPTGVVFDTLNSATEGVVKGRRTILAGTNNYLGLTFDKACIAAGVAALESQGLRQSWLIFSNALTRWFFQQDIPPTWEYSLPWWAKMTWFCWMPMPMQAYTMAAE